MKLKKKQSGIVVLMLVIALVLAISSFYFSSISIVDIQIDNETNTQIELKRAKQALLDYAVAKWHEPGEGGNIGRLPCPDTGVSGEGVQGSSCGNDYANGIGLLPWRTLGIDVPKDDSGSCFIYVVSPAYKSGTNVALNPDSFGQIQIIDSTGAVIQGATPEDRPVAVIIAPGKALKNQARVFDSTSICGNDYPNVVAYLDYFEDGVITNDNGTAIDPGTNNNIEVLINRYAGSDDADNENPLNDRLTTITHKEFWNALNRSVSDAQFNNQMNVLTEMMAICLAHYGFNNGDRLPMPALLDLNGNEYRNDNSYQDSSEFDEGYSGRFPYNVQNANTELALLPAPPLVNNNILFKNIICDAIDLESTAATESLWFTDPSVSSDSLQGEYYDLWSNWKDHFFYAVSESHNPEESPDGLCGDDCVEIDGTEYAAIVFFSGLILDGIGQQRYTRPFDGGLANKMTDMFNVDDKDDVKNYLENNNDLDFPVYSGNPVSGGPVVVVQPNNDGHRDFDPAGVSNDVRFCINPDMTVVAC